MTQLPAALAPWATALSTLEVAAAVALGPLLRTLDTMVSRYDNGTGQGDVFDGYSGITRHGIPERILMSEWALADEFPLEFLRRAAGNELLHMAPAYQNTRRRGRIAVLADTGPDQIGASRLVQLAALIVLHRRAQARGSELALGVLGDEAGRWREGDIAQLLLGWVSARRSTAPEADDVRRWSADLTAADEMWVLTGPRLARHLPGRPHTLVCAESAWDANGATAVKITLADADAELPLPGRNVAVRTLRGAAFRQAVETSSGGMRYPLFSSGGQQLIGRGKDLTEIRAVHVPQTKVRQYRFPGPVVAASYLGRRLVALCQTDDTLVARVIGKKLGGVDRISLSLKNISLDDAMFETLRPLYFDSGALLFNIDGKWWHAEPSGKLSSLISPTIAAVATGPVFDSPLRAYRTPTGVWVNGSQLNINPGSRVFLGGGLKAWSADGIEWALEHPDDVVTIEDGAQVIGLHRIDGKPTLITLSRAGLLVRAVRLGKVVTLSKWSAGITPPTVHPTKPWIAVEHSDGKVEVGDLQTGELLLRLRGDR
ncbi:hypothetical protein [Actinocrispum wychmicini]|uniref:Uncharacterized protein n=1 Tax=Actinocrispum wychmicini TaxID=1213861 RepID=A0A4R2JSJ9_9PSEU|nr:hypothetical protein [Actinocrispum wychmicini]TCO62077.1 hypothetical protein EV192_102214 [Actinocrispum wychmicini]